MTKILLITNAFPYLPGEQFLETEVKFYTKCDVTVMPQYYSKDVRSIASDIKINHHLVENVKKLKRKNLIDIKNALFSKYFFKECINNNLFNLYKLKILIGSIIKYNHYYDILDNYLLNVKDLDNTIIYTYWHTEVTYALQSLKKKYNYQLISRIHGYDLYQERDKFNYLPLKKQFTNNIDKIYTITESANKYLKKTYHFNDKTLELSRLGVLDHGIESKVNKKDILHLVSCSFLTSIKRIDKIIDALIILSETKQDVNYIWTHLGDGHLFENLLKEAKIKLTKLNNISFEFKGNMGNNEVYEFYNNNNIDVFINVSESEGVPVSIMEAMSCHIPIIAPNIGGISEMIIDGFTGFLLKDKFQIEELVNALSKVDFYKNEITRNGSYDIFKNKYSANKNYKLFVNNLCNKKDIL